MQRRKFVQLSGASIAAALAGCLDGGNSNNEETPDDAGKDTRNRVGDSVTHDGLKATVYGYDLVDEYALYDQFNDKYNFEEDSVRVPTPGGVFLMIDFGIKNIGEKKIPIPGFKRRGQSGIRGDYGGSSIQFMKPEEKIQSKRGHEYETIYPILAEQRQAYEDGIFPGYELRAWIITEVSRDFNRGLATLTVDLDARREGEHIEEWTFDNTKPNRVPEGYEHDFDSGGDKGEEPENKTTTTSENGNSTADSGNNETTTTSENGTTTESG